MLPQGQYFTEEELLDLCFRIPTKKTDKMLKPTYDGYSDPIKAIYPERKVVLAIERNFLDSQSIVLLGSHCTPTAKVLGSSRTFSGNTKREFVVIVCSVNQIGVAFDIVLAELALRPTVINTIQIPHKEGFAENLQLVVSQDCVFAENPKTVIDSEQTVLEDGSIVHVFTLSSIIKNTQSLTLEGIGTAVALALQVTLDLGVSYADF